jgi:hypothetical protein
MASEHDLSGAKRELMPPEITDKAGDKEQGKHSIGFNDE